MNDTASTTDRQDIVVDDVFPHAPATIWKALTNGDLIGRWLMAPTGFAPVEGTHFTFQTTPGGAWDGVIHCEVLEVVRDERLVYAWRGGHAENVGYGAPLDTVVTWTLAPVAGGTRLRLVHAGFVTPRNDSALTTMTAGWTKVVRTLGTIAGERHLAAPRPRQSRRTSWVSPTPADAPAARSATTSRPSRSSRTTVSAATASTRAGRVTGPT